MRSLGGDVEIDPTPQEVPWSVPLDEDEQHSSTTRPGRRVLCGCDAGGAGAGCVSCAISRPLDTGQRVVGLVRLGRGAVLRPFRRTVIQRLHPAKCQGCATGGDRLVARSPAYPHAAFYAYAHPAPDGFESPALRRGSTLGALARRVHPGLGRLCTAPTRTRPPRLRPLGVPHACTVCEWNPALAATAQGTPPPVA